MISRKASFTAALAALGLLAALFASGASAAAPHWSISSTATPSHFTPGASGDRYGYYIAATNTGDAPSDGSPITITDTLPAGLTASEGPIGSLFEFHGIDEGNEELFCDLGPPATCSGSPIIYPGARLNVFVPVDVAPFPGIEPLVTNEVTISGGGAPDAFASEQTPVSEKPATSGFQSINSWLANSGGVAATQAGSHPFQFHFDFQLNTNNSPDIDFNGPPETPRNVKVTFPNGLIVNPSGTPARCTEAQLEISAESECPAAAAVGVDHASGGVFGFVNGAFVSPVYNMFPPPGVAAAFAFNVSGFGIYIHLMGGVDTAGDYAITVDTKDIVQAGNVSGLAIDLWGDPSAPSHDYRRGPCAVFPALYGTKCPVPQTDTPLLALPSACSGPLEFSMRIESWENPANPLFGSVPTADVSGNPVGVTGCAALEFDPSLEARPTTNVADSPSGLAVDLHVPQNESLSTLATANLRKTVITLPKGLLLNPAGANGLDACSSAQIGLTTPIGQAPIHFTADPPNCPDGSKIGTVEVDTSLVDHPVPGAVYVAKPSDNPFGSLLAIYIVLEDPTNGVIVKLAGHVVPDPQSGQLVTTVDQNPQLPFSDFKVNLKAGPHAVLRTPATCGEYSSTSELTPWSAPQSGPPATPSDTYAIASAPGGGSCPANPAAQPHAPSFDAGTISPIAGAQSPFVMHLRREDDSQTFSELNVSPPPGLVAKLAGTTPCPAAALAAAAQKSGAQEQASPSCPASSRVGSVTAGAGAGPAPYYAKGTAYIAGPYKGAPLSLAIVTPAVAGPFDLGTVVIRTALHLDPVTARIRAQSDPIPQILQGVVLDLRTVDLALDRPDFTLNPTSCEPMAVEGQLSSSLGQLTPLFARFQLGECTSLHFKPAIGLRLKGATKRGGHPALTATIAPRPGDANIASVSVALPHSEFLDQSHIRTICTRVQFAADSCPPRAVYGEASVSTPLLSDPLSGHAYLRSSPEHELPDLVTDLRGTSTYPIKLEAAGRTDSINQGIRNTFDFIPDAPFTKAVVALQGGGKGLLVNSRDICANAYRATVKFTAHNGETYAVRPKLKAQCGKKGVKRGKQHRRGGPR